MAVALSNAQLRALEHERQQLITEANEKIDDVIVPTITKTVKDVATTAIDAVAIYAQSQAHGSLPPAQALLVTALVNGSKEGSKGSTVALIDGSQQPLAGSSKGIAAIVISAPYAVKAAIINASH